MLTALLFSGSSPLSAYYQHNLTIDQGTISFDTLVEAGNHRSLSLELDEEGKETLIDPYSAVRNGYLQKREAKIKD